MHQKFQRPDAHSQACGSRPITKQYETVHARGCVCLLGQSNNGKSSVWMCNRMGLAKVQGSLEYKHFANWFASSIISVVSPLWQSGSIPNAETVGFLLRSNEWGIVPRNSISGVRIYTYTSAWCNVHISRVLKSIQTSSVMEYTNRSLNSRKLNTLKCKQRLSFIPSNTINHVALNCILHVVYLSETLSYW